MAEEVAKIDPDLVVLDQNGKPYTVRYEAVNAMLLNEFLKEHGKVAAQTELNQKQDMTISKLKTELAEERREFGAIAAKQEAEIKALTSGLQKVSERVSISKPSARIVTNE